MLQLRNLTLSFGERVLLDEVSVQIERGERICLLGRNGAGKSTLVRIVGGELKPDAGHVDVEAGAKIATLPQAVPEGLEGTVADVVGSGLGEQGSALAEYDRVARMVAEEGGEFWMRRLDELQQSLDAAGGWETHLAVEAVLTRMGLPPEVPFQQLSGGMKRRVLLARTLVDDPDLLLLDEPTNHLDIEAIQALEETLLGFQGALLFITHDRALLRKLATRIIELDRGRLFDWSCDYDTFLERKAAWLEAQEKQWAEFDRKLAEEEAWIRRGIKARRTRNEGRVRALLRMREERRQRVEREGEASLNVASAERSGRRVIEAKGVSFAYDDTPVIRSLDTTIMRGDRIGVIGPNGSGKTTLLRLLLGQLEPDTGRVKLGTNLSIAYFDQHRAQLDPNRTAQENVAPDGDMLTVNGKPRHVLSYLKDFLFTPDRARTYTHQLSGGERNRLLLARLFLRPSNVLVLDEPTNDLDIETLELLEELLLDFDGTVLIVSHDRAFLNNVVTGTLVLEDGRVRAYVGGYDDWLRQRKPSKPAPEPEKKKPKASKPRRERSKGLSYKEKRELEALPTRIETLEAEQQDLYALLGDPSFYKQEDGAAVTEARARLDELEELLETAYSRWETLEQQAS